MVIISHQTVRVKQAHYIQSCNASSLFLSQTKQSAVFCLSCNEEKFPIPSFPQILLPPVSVVQSGEIILFPVSVNHSYSDFVSLSVPVLYYTV